MLIKHNKATVHRNLFTIDIQLMSIDMAAKVIILFKQRDLMHFAEFPGGIQTGNT